MIDEEYGVFVSPDGDDDSGDGSRANPYATIAKGIEEAAASEKRVYACADGGVYDESVTIDDAASGLEMFGGFSCDDWSYSETAKSRVASPTALALHIDGVTGVRIEDFAFEAADATMPGESSIGGFVVNSTSVLFRRAQFGAGTGRAGESGTLEGFAYPAQSALNGNSESAAGGEKTCPCQSGLSSIGGAGGPPASSGQAGSMGLPNHGGGQPGTPGSCGSTGTGNDGAPAPAAERASGALSLGTASATGWQSTAGDNGVPGAPGQGGGGGASRNGVGRGGGGGCGGCGGNGGKGGQGGGSSIALLVVNSPVVLESCALVARDAGNGGSGRAGQPGQQDVGAGGGVILMINSCGGGNGGPGGSGGASGGGAGGISVGLVWNGEEPMIDAPMFTLGSAGGRGIGGDPGNNDGVDGVAREVLEVP